MFHIVLMLTSSVLLSFRVRQQRHNTNGVTLRTIGYKNLHVWLRSGAGSQKPQPTSEERLPAAMLAPAAASMPATLLLGNCLLLCCGVAAAADAHHPREPLHHHALAGVHICLQVGIHMVSTSEQQADVWYRLGCC